MGWTPEQELAIEAEGTRVLVAAAAGAGKTATLVERVLRRVLGGLDLDRLLVVTFTEAAATEMRQRIAREVKAALARDPGSAFLRRQLSLLDRASIRTLHAFCLGLVRQHFYRLGLDPGVRVADEHEAALLREEALDAVFEAAYAAPDPEPFLALVDRYGGLRGDARLREAVEALWSQAVQMPWPWRWLEEVAARFEDPPGSGEPWVPSVQAEVAGRLEEAVWLLRRALRLAALPGGPAAYGDVLAGDLARLEVLLRTARSGTWEDLRQGLLGFEFGTLPRLRADAVRGDLKKTVTDLRERVKEVVRQELAGGVPGRPLGDLLAELRSLAPLVRTLVGLVRELDREYATAKSARGLVDFHDIERLALQVLLDPGAPEGTLAPSAVAREVQARYAAVLVDEYQDINPLQDAILTLVSRDGGEAGPPNLFMVGDVKQSIYRFRHAEPRLFLDKYHRYSRDGEGPGRRIDLQANFRSRPSVLRAVNFLFRQIMTPGAGEVAYDRAAELVPGAEYPEPPATSEPSGGPDGPAPAPPGAAPAPWPPGPPAGEAPVEMYLIAGTRGEGGSAGEEGSAGEGGGDDPEGAEPAGGEPAEGAAAGADEEAEMTALEREASLAAGRIRALLDGGTLIWDREEGRYRPLRPRDVVILLRSLRPAAAVVAAALEAAGIPAYADAGSGYFGTVEVQTVLSLLAVIDNPRQDIPLAAVLRSSVVGLDAGDLARIRLAAPGADFYGAVRAAAAGEGGEAVPAALADRLRGFLERLETWRGLARRLPLSRLLWHLYEETGLVHHALGLPEGAQRHANLLALHDRARQFDQFSRQGLFRFLRFVERLRERGQDMAEASPLGEGEDVVRILSIHKAKGLEFPVVVVLGLGRRFNLEDTQGDLLVHRDLGLGPRIVDPDLRLRYPSLAHRAVAARLRQEALAEEMRVLYVALTRARERLVLVGTVASPARSIPAWADLAACHTGWPLPDGLLAGANAYLDWLGPALCRHAGGAPLRRWAAGAGSAGTEAAGVPADPGVAADPSRWHVAILSPAEAVAAGAGGAPREPVVAPPGGKGSDLLDLRERLCGLEPLPGVTLDGPGPHRDAALRLRWTYPYADVARRRAKTTVSDLVHWGRGPDAGPSGPDEDAEGPEWAGAVHPEPARLRALTPARPRFLQAQPATLTPAEAGSATHRVLQLLDLGAALDEADIARQVRVLVEREVLTAEQAAAVPVADLARFFASPLGARLRAAPDRVRREVAFTAGVPAAEVFPDLDPEQAAGERVTLQGMVDCVLEEPDGGLVIIDFKTDDVGPEEAGRAADRHRPQVLTYARVLGEVLRRPVREVWLAFLRPGVNVPVGPVAGAAGGLIQ
ncbi:UvrD-helicase domain-containing protein [Caldinitratiruptor microaerophilus]|uniref:ATP-dependent helicase/nuclease subunit A n=1 Tax=Caldinitratiruptor microaerophilus TaxID=671077 RepID=A0AA35CJS6_9FIRM|nr:UvrD-helicase domain-containing protein [Caldinitratiruptor microaerophilus]BDG60497.1 hypothetical protein caldi_15870 [Caldinitratiruptor microaerophilus]